MIDIVLGMIGLTCAFAAPVLILLFPWLKNRVWVAKLFVSGFVIIGGALGCVLYSEQPGFSSQNAAARTTQWGMLRHSLK